MKAEREKIHAKVKADTVRLNGSKLELTADEETCTFLLVSEGSCTLQMGENSLLLNPGSALLLGAGDAVLSAAGAAYRNWWLSVPAQRPARAAQRHPAGFCPAVFARRGNGAVRPGAVGSPPAHPAGDDARCHAGAGLPPAGCTCCSSCTMSSRSALPRAAPQRAPATRPLSRCVPTSANYRQKFSLTEVAARFYLSPYYLSRLFRRVTGQSIVDYLNNRRIELRRSCWRPPSFPSALLPSRPVLPAQPTSAACSAR